MDDIEAMFSMRGVSRERLRFVPDEGHNGAVAGRLIVIEEYLPAKLRDVGACLP
jgi:predicted O-linked N-acetylglucosamine transferase (SPINDLY family)